MSKATVVVRHLNAPHQTESLTKFQPLNDALKAEIQTAVGELFDRFGGAALLKESKEVFVKPNGIDGQPYCYTRPEVVEAVIRYWYAHGAKKVYLFENSTQSNATRLVYAVVGYDAICKRTGAVPVYLDEDKTVEFTFEGKPSEKDDPLGYQNNPLTLLQILYLDHGGKGGWTMVMGEGHDTKEINAITGKVLIVGDCAINEVGDRLISRLGKKNVYLSHKCNSLADSAAAMFHLMHVNPMEFAPINPIKATTCLLLSKRHGSSALVPSVFSNIIKTV